MDGTFSADAGNVQESFSLCLLILKIYPPQGKRMFISGLRYSQNMSLPNSAKEWKEVIITEPDDSGNEVINMGVTTDYLSPF